MDSRTPRELDIDGDVVLVLRNPNTSFPTTSDSVKPVNNEKPGDHEKQDDNVSMRLRVSSKHLALASPYFRRMFKGDWTEGNSLRCDGSVTVDVEGWDPEALLIVMNVIHGHTRQLPRLISLGMLGKIAVIVDYYECFEIVEIYSQMWTNDLRRRNGISTSSKEDVLVWILVSCVFGQADPFRIVTDAAIRCGTCRLEAKGLPIPYAVLEKIHNRRTKIISSLINSISTFFVETIGTIQTCSLQNNYAIAAIFAEKLRVFNLLSLYPSSSLLSSLRPWPTPPFEGFSAAGIIDQLRCIKSLDVVSCKKSIYSQDSCNCNVRNLIRPIVDSHESQIRGLKLKDFSELKDKEKPSLQQPTSSYSAFGY